MVPMTDRLKQHPWLALLAFIVLFVVVGALLYGLGGSSTG
jgi:hypothetical protein